MEKTNKPLKQIGKNILANNSHWASFFVLVVLAIVIDRNFLSWHNVTNQFVQGALVGISAMGMSLVITAGMIDLSVGSTVAIVSGFGVAVLNRTLNIWVMLAFCLVFGTILGLVNGFLIAKGNIAPFIVTLATMSAYRSIVTQVGENGPFTVAPEIFEPFRKIASGNFLNIPNLMIIFLLITALTWFIMNKLKFGRYVYAIGSNQQAARLTGVRVERVKIMIFGYTGILAGLTAFLLASRLTAIQASSAGDGYEMDAIAAVAIGGTSMDGGKGKIIGTLLGVLMLRIINTILVMANVPPFLNGLVRGIIIIVAVLAQSKRKTA